MYKEPLRLLADGMLGRLAKWLRLMGYDTAYDNAADDHELARRSRAEGRVLLTRDTELAGRRGLRTLLIQSEILEEQEQEVQDALGPSPHPALSRCTVCNAELESASSDDVADCVLFALTRPLHVNIDEMVIKALAQSSGGRILRRET